MKARVMVAVAVAVLVCGVVDISMSAEQGATKNQFITLQEVA